MSQSSHTFWSRELPMLHVALGLGALLIAACTCRWHHFLILLWCASLSLKRNKGYWPQCTDTCTLFWCIDDHWQERVNHVHLYTATVHQKLCKILLNHLRMYYFLRSKFNLQCLIIYHFVTTLESSHTQYIISYRPGEHYCSSFVFPLSLWVD